MPIDPEAKKTLDNRLANGEIGIEEYEQLLQAINAGKLNTSGSPMLTPLKLWNNPPRKQEITLEGFSCITFCPHYHMTSQIFFRLAV